MAGKVVSPIGCLVRDAGLSLPEASGNMELSCGNQGSTNPVLCVQTNTGSE